MEELNHIVIGLFGWRKVKLRSGTSDLRCRETRSIPTPIVAM